MRGPRRGYLYYWRTSRAVDIDTIGLILTPWLSEPKRSQLIAAAELAGRAAPIERRSFSQEHELAWAAGFFGGDGTVSACQASSENPARYLRARIAQAGPTGEPDVLRRFKAALNDAGSIRGPFNPNNPCRQPQYAWQASGSAGVELILQRLWSSLDDAKREQARRAIRLARQAGPHRTAPPAHEVFGLDLATLDRTCVMTSPARSPDERAESKPSLP